MDHPARHTCLIYDGTPTAHLKYLMSLMVLRLKMQHRCLFLGSPAMVAGAFSALSESGLDVLEEMKKGSLVLSSDRAYLKNGLFDPAAMLDSLEQMVDQALADGYRGLWATGDMNWEFGAEENLKKLLEYECGLEKLFHKKAGLEGICQYSKNTLPPHILVNALQTHSGVFVNETLYGVNMSYTEPDKLLNTPPARKSRVDMEDMLQMLRAA